MLQPEMQRPTMGPLLVALRARGTDRRTLTPCRTVISPHQQTWKGFPSFTKKVAEIPDVMRMQRGVRSAAPPRR